jgi:hypothetical protein
MDDALGKYLASPTEPPVINNVIQIPAEKK